MSDATGSSADWNAFCRLDGLGLVSTGCRVEPQRAVITCRVVAPDDWCHRCGGQGRARDTVTRRLAHEPFGWRPTILEITVRRYRCVECGHVWRQSTDLAAWRRAKISRRGLRWALESLVIGHLAMNRIAAGLGVSWDTANTAVLAEAKHVLIDNEHRFDNVAVIGVDEHKWRHIGRDARYVTVIIDLTAVRNGSGPARLLDMVPGRSKQAFKAWLAERPQPWRDGIEVVAMDGFTGFKTAAAEELPTAICVMDPFHVVQLVGRGLEHCRQRVQQATRGHRGRRGDPLYANRRTLLTGQDLLTDWQCEQLMALFTDDAHIEVEVTWGIYQRIITAYRHPNPRRGHHLMNSVIKACSHGVPAALTEVRKLGRTLKRRAKDILAYFDHPRTSNGPTEALNGRLEHLRGIALGFRNLTNYTIRALLETGGLKPQLHPRLG